MSACSTFTEHVWKPGECKNCFKPKSLHRLQPQSSGRKAQADHRLSPPQQIHQQQQQQQQNQPSGGAMPHQDHINAPQRPGSVTARSAHFRPPVAKKPTIAVKPTMMPPCASTDLDPEGNHHLHQQHQQGQQQQRPPSAGDQGKTSAFTVWNRNGLNRKRPAGPSNNNEGEDRGGGEEIEGYAPLSPPAPPAGNNNNNSGLTDVLKEIVGLGLGPGPGLPPLCGSRDLFFGRINTSYRRSLERGLPAASCLALGPGVGGGGSGGSGPKRVSLSDSAEVISCEGGRYCYPEFSSDDEDDEEEEESEEDEDDEEEEDNEHESWDESDEELLAMEIRMRGQPRFAIFRAATLSPVRFAAGKKWNTVPLRNRSLQRICAVDYDDSYDEILNGYPSMDSNGALLPYGQGDTLGSGFISNSDSATSPESSSSLPGDSRTASSSGSSAPCGLGGGVRSPVSPAARAPSKPCAPEGKTPADPRSAPQSPARVAETHLAVLAIRLEEQGKDGMPMPQALPGQPVTISFSPTEEQPKPYRVVNLEKSLICKPYTVVDVSASMASKEEQTPDPASRTKSPVSPAAFPGSPLRQPLSPSFPMFPTSPTSPATPTSAVQPLNPRRKAAGSIRYQEVWTSSTSPRQKIARIELGSGSAHGPAAPPRHCSHKSAPTSPISGLSSSRTVPVKSPNLSEIKFNSFNNAGMPPFPIIIRDEPAYARSAKNAVKVPIVINPSAYDNLAVYKSFLGLSGELPPPKGAGSGGSGGRVTSHTYEEIGSSDSVQSGSTDQTLSGKGTGDRAGAAAAAEQPVAQLEVPFKTSNVQPRTDPGTASASAAMSGATGTVSPPTSPVNAAGPLGCNASLPKRSPTATAATQSGPRGGESPASRPLNNNTDLCVSFGAGSSHREEASAVLSQIVASIQPPQSPPESPSEKSKTFSSEELYAIPPDAQESLVRPKSLFSSPDGGLSKPKKETPSRVLPKSHSASAAVPLSSPAKAEPGAPFPPPRSTSSPYHATNILQRHFGNWSKSPASGSPTRPADGEPGTAAGEGARRAGAGESAKPKRWISFKSFFRRRREDDEQKDKAEREKDKGKLVGLDGTVIHILPPPPVQRHHWFAEAKPEDPTQKPTIIFTYKPDDGAGRDGEEKDEEVEEGGGEVAALTPEGSQDPPQAVQRGTPSPHSSGADIISEVFSQVPAASGQPGATRDLRDGAASLAARLLRPSPTPRAGGGGGLKEEEEDETYLRPYTLTTILAAASEGSASLGDPENDSLHSHHSHHSHSPASSACSATYSNLGQSRANMIPPKQPRNLKTSNDTLASLDLDGLSELPFPKSTPPPLPKKSVPRSSTEPAGLAGKDPPPVPVPRPWAEAKPGGTNLSVANPLYDLESTWESASQSSSLSSEPHRLQEPESGDSLERAAAAPGSGKGRPANSLTSLGSPAPNAAPGTRERRGCRSAESLTGKARTTGRGTGGAGASAKTQVPILYRGMDSWEEVVGRIRALHTDTLRKLAARCEDRFMAGQKDPLRFGTDSWSHFRLTAGKPCCEAGDAVYYTASYAKDPLVNYAIKICRSKVKETQQQFFHSLAVRQSLALHFNIQQDCGHFLADVPARLLPWEETQGGDQGDDDEDEEEEEGDEEDAEGQTENDAERRNPVCRTPDARPSAAAAEAAEEPSPPANSHGSLRSRVVVITREVPFQTVADFVRQGASRHARNPELYERQVCLLLLQLCSGLEHMKPHHVTHCDLRLENLLLVHCLPGAPANPGEPAEPNNNNQGNVSGASPANGNANAASASCPARLIISNFSQAKQRSRMAAAAAADAGTLRDQSRLAPEIVTATQYRKCDEFQTGILIYEMLHRANPFEETPELKEREYTWADLPPLPRRSLYSQGLQQLASLLLTVNPSERIRMAEARACLQCLLWGPREDLFQALGGGAADGDTGQRETTLQNWLDLKRTLMMIKFAERSLDTGSGVSLEDWLCCQYLAFASTETLGRVVHILRQPHPQAPPPPPPHQHAPPPGPATAPNHHLAHSLHLTHSQPL